MSLDVSRGMDAARRTSLTQSPLKRALSGGMLRRALITMLVVGSLLNLINQGDALWGDAALNIPKLLLTFSVPFCVATFGAWSALVDGDRQDAS